MNKICILVGENYSGVYSSSIHYISQNRNIIRMKKRMFDVIFILISTIILILLSEYGLLEKYMAYSLIPILIAYFLGQYSERKFKNE